MRRKIAPSERMYVGEIRTQAVTVCVVRGGVDPELLDEAFTAVLAEHLPLRCRIEQDGADAYLTPLVQAELPRLEVRPDGPDVPVQEYNKPLHLGGPLVRAVLLTGSDEDKVIFGLDHAICDGRTATAFCNRVWQRYGDIQAAAGSWAPEPVSQEFPPSLDELLPPRTDAELDAYVQERLRRAEGAPVASLPYLAASSASEVPQDRIMNTRRLRLTESETAGLVAHAKQAGVTVNGLVGAVLLTAVRNSLPADHADHRLSVFSAVDLRGQVALAQEAMVPAASWYRDLFEVAVGDDLVKLGKRLGEGLRGGIERGDTALEIQALSRLLRHMEVWPTSLMLTSTGRLAGPPSPDGLEIVDMTKFGLSSKWNPQLPGGPLIAQPTTIFDRFSIEMPYSTQCFTTEQMDGIHDYTLEALRECADVPPLP
ncbi:phthiocerol/phthiodiolone dimycocerosyl transferase family protein [Streptomyces sp. NPDC002513]